MVIKVKDFLGENFHVEDAIVLREYIYRNLNDNIVLDFVGVNRVSSTFFTCLFSDLIYRKGRDTILQKISVKNLSNMHDYSRVVKGTSF